MELDLTLAPDGVNAWVNHWNLSDRAAASLGDLGYIVFGPGPRKWTVTFHETGAVYEVVSHEDKTWHLRLLRCW